jgi:hypothetical protein
MNHSKTTLAIASIVVAGVLTGVALAILLQQAFAHRHQPLYALGTPRISVDGANGTSANGSNGINGDAVANTGVFLN